MTTQQKVENARAYLRKLPPAQSGAGGHPATYRAASILAHGFDLGWEDAWALLNEWNVSHCTPPWSEKELRHKLSDAYAKPHDRPKGWIVKERQVGANGRFVFNPDLAAPVEKPHAEYTTADVLLNCFKEDEVVCITCEAGCTDDGKWFPASKGSFLTRKEWMERFFGPGVTAGAAFKASESGTWVRINPFIPNQTSGLDTDVAQFRHVLVEFDRKPKDEQKAVFLQSNLPITLMVDSGGKSIHAWVRVDAKDKAEWEERRNDVYAYLADHEPDPQNKNPSRWSRLGGVMRGDKEQKIIGFNFGAASWDDFIAWRDEQDMPEEVSTDTLEEFDTKNDPNTMVGHGRWLQRGGSLLITAQSGIGKSSFAMQMSMSWACGRELFGIPTKRPLRIGIFQAEGDVGDMAEAFQGVSSGMRLSPQEMAMVKENLKFFAESSRSGQQIIDMARKIVVRHKLDMVVLDPLMAYVDGDISKGVECKAFFRGKLEPMLKETGCIAVLIHHETKPKSKEATEGQTFSDMMYSGGGHSELFNYVRSIINVKREHKDKPIFSFNITKRGDRAGMRLPDGKPTLSIKLKHASDRIYWEVSDQVAAGFKLLQVGEQFKAFADRTQMDRRQLMKELTEDHGLERDQADAMVKALVSNGIIETVRVGPVIYYVGVNCRQ